MSVYSHLRRAWNKIMKEFQEDITITHITSQTFDSYDRLQKTTEDTNTQGVIYRFEDEYDGLGFGNLRTGEIAFLLSKDETITEKDKITHDSKTYEVDRIEKFKTRGGLIGLLAYCKKEG